MRPNPQQMEHRADMTTHTDYKLSSGILFFTDATPVYGDKSTIATLAEAVDGQLQSGKMLSKEDLRRAVDSMDKSSGPSWLDTSKHHGGGLLYQNGADVIWWTGLQRRKLSWVLPSERPLNMYTKKRSKSVSVNWPSLIFRRTPSNELFVAAWEVSPRHELEYEIRPLVLPDVSCFRVHTCSVNMKLSDDCQTVEDLFFNSRFTRKPKFHNTFEVRSLGYEVYDKRVKTMVAVDRSLPVYDLDGFYNATC